MALSLRGAIFHLLPSTTLIIPFTDSDTYDEKIYLSGWQIPCQINLSYLQAKYKSLGIPPEYIMNFYYTVKAHNQFNNKNP